MSLDFERVVSTLSRHGVTYVLIGGAAALAHGSTLTTEDVDLAPSRFAEGYDALAPRAIEVDFGDGTIVLVAALDDIIASKRAADRPKDRAALPYLEALADEIARGS